MVTVRNLYYTINGKEVLRDINLHVDAGQAVAVMGISGSGKTTLLKIMASLTKPTAGQVLIGQTDITNLPEEQLNQIRRRIGVVFQQGALFDSLTVYENVAFGLMRHSSLSRREINDIVEEKLSLVGLSGTEKLMPSQLSGGMQKRVGLARALAMDPEILFYDEPTSGLDPIMTTIIDDLIIGMRDRLGVTSVVVSHDLRSIFRVADRVAMLHEGTVIAMGSAEEIQQSADPRVRQFVEGLAEGPIQPQVTN